MEIELLKTFQKVAENESISKTADDFYLSVSTVTSRIKALERELGIELFHRTGRSFKISNEGQRFLLYVDRFIKILEEGTSKVTQTYQQFRGELKLTVSTNITNYILPPLLKCFREKYPDIKLKIILSSNYKLIDRISNGHMELGVANHSVNEGGLMSQVWFKDRIVPVLPRSHPLATEKMLTPQMLEHYPFIGYAHHTRKWKVITDWFLSANIKPNVIIYVNEVGLVKKFLQRLEAVSFLPYISVKKDLNNGRFITIPTSPELPDRDIVFVYKKNLELSQAANVFIDFAQQFQLLNSTDTVADPKGENVPWN